MTINRHSSEAATVVTTSWDDGHVLDDRLADLLDTYSIAGTFYLAPKNVELAAEKRLSDRSVARIAENFEIGGHTLNHLKLTALDDASARREIASGKAYLEQIIQAPLESFCYPCGAYAVNHPSMVEEAGFRLGRTVQRWQTASDKPFEMSTTMNAYRHLVDGPRILRLARGNLRAAHRMFWNWDELAIALFDEVVATGGVYHLWGHSWEIDLHGDWQRLTRVLEHIGGRPEVAYVENGALARSRANGTVRNRSR